MTRYVLAIICVLFLIGSCDFRIQNKPTPSPASNTIIIKALEEKADEKLLENDIDSAIIIYQEAVRLAAGDPLRQAELYVNLGGCYFENNNIPRTINTITFSLNLFNKIANLNKSKNQYWTGGCLLLANCYRINRSFDSAFILLNDIHKDLSQNSQVIDCEQNYFLLSEVYSWKALVYFDVGDFENAIAYNIKSIEITEKYDPQQCQIANNYSQLGKIFVANENYIKSEQYFVKALKIIENCYGSGSFLYGRLLTELGFVYYEANRYQEAYNCFTTTHEILQQNDLAHGLEYAYSYNNLGDVLCGLGKYNEGIRYYFEALQFFIENGFQKEASIVYHNLGNAYNNLKNYTTAEKYYHKALKYSKENDVPKNINTAFTHQRIGQIYLSQGDIIQAINSFSEAINELWISNYNLMKLDATVLHKSVLSKTELYRSLYYKGYCELLAFKKNRQLSRLKESISSFDKALQLQDLIRNYYNNEEAKLYLSEISSPLIEGCLSALICSYPHGAKVDLDNKILEVIERSKFSALRSLLNSTRSMVDTNIPSQVLMSIDSLNKKIRFYENILSNNLSQTENEYKLHIEGLLFESVYNLDTIYNYLRRNFHNYNCTQSQSSYYSIPEIQNLIPDTLGVIEYYQSDSLIIVVSINKHSHKIHHFDIDHSFNKMIDNFISSIQFSNIASIVKCSEYLFDYLIQPVYPILQGLTSLIIIPDNHLYKVPFELLITTNLQNSMDFQNLEFLIGNHDISYQYSLGLWADKIKYSTGEGIVNWDNSFVGFAPLGSSGENYYSILPFSTKEINMISRIFNTSGGTGISYIGDQSSEDMIAAELQKSKIVHIASHSHTNAHLLAHHIVLSFPHINTKEKDSYSDLLKQSSLYNTHDGQLYLSDIYNMNIRSELVTLSTCSSGAGEYFVGEGTRSLAQGFYYSGAKNILYTLWGVSDKHSYEFMKVFYSYISQGLTYSRALKNTKLTFIKSDFRLPIFWCGYLLIG